MARSLLNGDFAVAPDAVAADAGIAGGFQVGNELGEVAFVFRRAGESADRVGLAGAAAASGSGYALEITARHADFLGALAHCAEVDFERAGSVKGAEGADAVADAGEEDIEFR